MGVYIHVVPYLPGGLVSSYHGFRVYVDVTAMRKPILMHCIHLIFFTYLSWSMFPIFIYFIKIAIAQAINNVYLYNVKLLDLILQWYQWVCRNGNKWRPNWHRWSNRSDFWKSKTKISEVNLILDSASKIGLHIHWSKLTSIPTINKNSRTLQNKATKITLNYLTNMDSFWLPLLINGEH